jgi:putative ubiquitin-RnfH superfamily antitoxin RatB of RatAB toxin-antitoxin module
MNIGVCYAETDRQLWLRLDVPEGVSVGDAIERSGLLQRFPEIDLKKQKVGVFGKIVKLDSPVREGDRIEIYRPIVADPKTVKRRRIKTDDGDA